MTIEGLNVLLKRQCPYVFKTIPITEVGPRIAIDIFTTANQHMAIAYKKLAGSIKIYSEEVNHEDASNLWLQSMMEFVIHWLRYGITPVVVFDGGRRPQKAETSKKRAKSKSDRQGKLDILKSTPVLSLTNEQHKEMKTLTNGLFNIKPSDYNKFKAVLKGLGIPCLTARYDAEQLCSALCLEGLVSAVLSTDTDNMAYLCPLQLIRKSKDTVFDNRLMEFVPQYECVRARDVLQGLNMTPSTFVDLCILLGCDFNTNIRGYGPVKSFDLILQYKCVKDIPLDKTCLDYETCKDIFTFQPSNTLIIDISSKKLQIEGFFEHNRDVLVKAGLGSMADRYAGYILRLPPPPTKCVSAPMYKRKFEIIAEP